METPGGKSMDKYHQKTTLSTLSLGLHLSNNVEKICKNQDFVMAFLQAVPDKEEQKKYLIHTSRYNELGNDYDPHYVLMFRRTLPSNFPKPEECWTDQYFTVLTWLKREIPHGPHRLHSIILCDTLEHILYYWEKKGGIPITDWEIVVNFPDYNQCNCLCMFKPSYEQEELEAYLKTEWAMNEQEILKHVMSSKKDIYSSLGE